MKQISFVLAIIGGLVASSFAIPAEQLEFFESKIRPVLAEQCYSCHSNEADKIKGGLFLDSKWGWETGGDSGPAVIPGDPDGSLLIDAVRRTEEVVDAMPPKTKLTDQQIADLEAWVKMGAPDPREKVEEKEGLVEAFDIEKRFAEHWSWRPVSRPEVPATKDETWASSEIDRFILAKLEDANLRPATPADDRIWLRRVYFDLIGLPPTPEQIREASTKSRGEVVDEILASPRFGEKWARHWMDLVRYAETCGHEFDYPIPNAHEYRDYLIRAFNLDLPYDEFIREHIAGDLLPNPRRNEAEKFNESVIATGHWYFHDATHAPTDVLQNESDHQDSQIDVMGKAFQALTIACARCHDHKFDAISTADYYALTGYLQSSARTEYPLDVGLARQTAVNQQKELRAQAQQYLKPTSTFKPGDYFLAASKLVREKLAAPKPSLWEGIVFEDFESGYDGWTVQGEAMGKQPASGPFGNQKPLDGFQGKGVVNSFNGSDKLLGKLISDPFVIEKPFVNFLVSGGRSGQTRIELQIDKKPVRQTSGKNNDKMDPTTWDVTEFVGKTARIWIIDNSSSGWGHINVDQIVFSDHRADKPFQALPDEALISATAEKLGLDPAKLTAWCEVLTSVDSKGDTPEGFLTKWTAGQKLGRVPNWAGFDQAAEAYRSESELFADFTGGDLPAGWSTTGTAFAATGVNTGLRFDPEAPISEPGMADSRLFGREQVGTLRSPTFEIGQDEIHVRMKAEKVVARVVIDNYHMTHFHTLLFNGTHFKDNSKETNTEGEFRWARFAGNLTKKYSGHRAYLEFIDRGNGYAVIDEIRLSQRAPAADRPHPLLGAIMETEIPESDESIASAMNAAWESGEPAVINWFSAHRLAAPSDIQPELGKLAAKGVQLARDLPAPRFAVAMAQGTPENSRVYIRGSHKSLGEEVPNRFLEVLGAEQGSRLDLANQIANPENPLTSRVMVNRLWHHLFGRGLVPTVDDFGPQGQQPSHPELLDWLATEFVESGWSIKAMLREMVLSQTYQQSSVPHQSLDQSVIASVDPENVLLHRMSVRRLQAEAIRDAVLAVSGGLNPKMYGPSVPTHRTAFMTGRGARGSGPLDGDGRRSVYLSIYRNFLNPFMLTFDMPGPFGPKGRRSNSNVPAQALAMMNDPFIIDQSEKWARAVLDQSIEDRGQRLAIMHEQALGTKPTESTLKLFEGFLEMQIAEHNGNVEKAWSDVAHALFNTKDFTFLR